MDVYKSQHHTKVRKEWKNLSGKESKTLSCSHPVDSNCLEERELLTFIVKLD